ESKDVFHTYWMVSILTRTAEEREELRNHLADKLIETRPVFYPVHTMPMYSEKYQKHPIAEDLGWRGINLPSFPSLSNEQVIYICESINEFYSDK
ncbi:GDP-perosamine synthase RfbE/PerA, partial [Escherichia coli]|nr:GDP-perosamine synthase RfbE/PerA [Escherichia coli]